MQENVSNWLVGVAVRGKLAQRTNERVVVSLLLGRERCQGFLFNQPKIVVVKISET